MTLHGLLPEEQRWLERKATLLGSLDSALRLLVRQGLLCEEQFLVCQREKSRRRLAAVCRALRPRRRKAKP